MSEYGDPMTADLHFFAKSFAIGGEWWVAAYWATVSGHPDDGAPTLLPYGDPYVMGPMDRDEADSVCRFVFAVIRQHDENMGAVSEAKNR